MELINGSIINYEKIITFWGVMKRAVKWPSKAVFKRLTLTILHFSSGRHRPFCTFQVVDAIDVQRSYTFYHTPKGLLKKCSDEMSM